MVVCLEILMFVIAFAVVFLFTFASFKYPIFCIISICLNLIIVCLMVMDGLSMVVGGVLVKFDVLVPVFVCSSSIVFNVLHLAYRLRM